MSSLYMRWNCRIGRALAELALGVAQTKTAVVANDKEALSDQANRYEYSTSRRSWIGGSSCYKLLDVLFRLLSIFQFSDLLYHLPAL